MKKYNIFQGRNGISNVVYDVLGYEKTESLSPTVTSDIYFQSYFYLCNRFGSPIIVDDYKKIMIWRFNVKQYTINIELNSSWVTFMIFGNGSSKKTLSKNNFINYSSRSPYCVRHWREQVKNKNKTINIFSEKKSEREIKIINKLWADFFELNGLSDDSWTNERFKKEKADEWIKELDNYNKKIINTDSFKNLSMENYSNSKTKHALKTLRQFINNMLTPIWVRDCSFNIKGRCGNEFDKYINNIKIDFEKPKQK
jgi:hypothetical protein